MRVISKRRLKEFWQQQAASRSPLEAWYRVVNDKRLAWSDFHDVKATYASASLVGECVVFNTHEQYEEGKWKKDCGCE